MNIYVRYFYVFALALSCFCSVFAGAINKGFKSLQIYNYFDAQQQFKKALKKEAAIANFGLAIIYERSDNPFHDYTKAYEAIFKADQLLYKLSDRQKNNYKKYGYHRESVDSLKLLLATNYYQQVILKEQTEIAFHRFTVLYTWAKERNQAISLRDSIAYHAASQQNTSAAFLTFCKKYPKSTHFSTAKSNYYRLQFKEQTATGTVSAYIAFLANFQDNPYIEEAQDRIYDLSTTNNSIDAYYAFVQTYPNNRNKEMAWRKVYQLFMLQYSEERFDEFLNKYTDYPFAAEVREDKQYATMQLYPFKQNGKMGWMNREGKIIYPAEYESLNFFKEGLAIASKHGKHGFVDKRNKIIIPFVYSGAYDFEDGRAIVEINEKYGIIDRTGTLVFDTVYTDIGQFSDELIYAQKDGKYSYYDKYESQIFDKKFEEAFAFEKGYAEVFVDSKQTLIDKQGTFVISPKYEEVYFFCDSLFIVSDGDFYGIINRQEDTILPFEYDEIGQLSEGLAVLISDEKMGYINASGKIIIEPKYEIYPSCLQQGQFTNGIAKVKWKNKFGTIDIHGKVVMPLKFENLGSVHSKRIAFAKGNKWGFVNPKGDILTQAIFDYAESFNGEYAIAEMLVQQGVINTKSEWIIPNKYSKIRLFEDDFWIASDGARQYLYARNGKLLSEKYYQQIHRLDEVTILLQNTNELEYYLIPDGKILKLEE